MDRNTSAGTAKRRVRGLLAIAAIGTLTIQLAPAGAVAAEPDACVYGYTPNASVFFGAGDAASGVDNYDIGNGCTIMDLVMEGVPFANHGNFVSNVNQVTNELRKEGVLTNAERSDISKAAAASEVGKPVQVNKNRSVDLSRIGLVSGTAGTIDGATLTNNPAVNLTGLASCGFQNIEFSGAVGRYHGHSAETLAPLASSVGIDVPSIGVSLNDLKTNLAGVISDAKTYGASYARFSPPSNWTLADFSREAAILNEIGAQLAPHGIKVGIHNHQSEFQTEENGVTGYDILLRETNPEFVTMEIDIGWSVSAGADTVELFQTYPGRFELLHFRDLADLNVPGVFNPVGEGAMDLAEVFAHYSLGGVEYGHTEHNAACQSLGNLAELRY